MTNITTGIDYGKFSLTSDGLASDFEEINRSMESILPFNLPILRRFLNVNLTNEDFFF